jgi:hypothetical protein
MDDLCSTPPPSPSHSHQAFLSIYAPIWADEFAPVHSKTKWLSLIQGGVRVCVVWCVLYAWAGHCCSCCYLLSAFPFCLNVVSFVFMFACFLILLLLISCFCCCKFARVCWSMQHAYWDRSIRHCTGWCDGRVPSRHHLFVDRC